MSCSSCLDDECSHLIGQTSVICSSHRGALKYHNKSYSSAIEDFTAAIALDPGHTSLAHFNRALCYQETGQLDKVCVWCVYVG